MEVGSFLPKFQQKGKAGFQGKHLPQMQQGVQEGEGMEEQKMWEMHLSQDGIGRESPQTGAWPGRN